MAKKFKDLQAEWNKSDSRKYIRAKLPTPQANVKSESAWDSYRETALLEAALDKPTRSPEQIAKKHGVSVEKIEAQLKDGIKVEQEHTSDLEVAREIALDHLGERPDYYTQVKKAKLEEAKLHHVLKGHPYHHKSDAELHYIIKDAGEAERAVGDHDPKAMNKYADQRCDASTVLGYRHRGGVRVPHPKLNESNRDTNFYSASPAERRRVGSIQTLTARAKRLRKMLTPRVTIKKTMKEELTPREQQSHRERLRPSEPPKHDPDEQVKKQQAEHDKNTLGMMRNIVFHKKLPSGSHLKEEAPHPGHVMNFSDRMEHSYHGYSQAKAARDAYATHLKSQGIKVKKSSTTNQLLHGSYGNVYKVSHTGHMEESYNVAFDESGPHSDKYSAETMELIKKIKLQKKNKKALLGRISVLNRKTVQEAFKAAKDKKNGKAPEKDSKNPFAKKDVKPQKEVQDNLPGDGANEPNKDVSAAPPQFGAGKVEAGAPGAEKKVSNTPTPERKSSKIQVKGPGPDDKFQDSPIVTPLLTMADTASPKSGSQGVR